MHDNPPLPFQDIAQATTPARMIAPKTINACQYGRPTMASPRKPISVRM
jgi:hypothetical protein